MSDFVTKDGLLSMKYNILPAPMCGIMDYPFRYIVSQLGSEVVYSEMIASHAVIDENRSDYIANMTYNKDIKNSKVVIQIAGRDPVIMGQTAKFFENRGVDGIDINFGCPVKKVVNGMAGSALMKDESLACEIVESVVNSVSCPVSIKTRIGWDSMNLNSPTLIEKFQQIGIKAATLHCRTRSQMYKGVADWTFLPQVKKRISIPIFVNGDIVNFQDYKNAMETSGADGAMIGRGMYGRPWLISSFINRQYHESKFIDHENNNQLIKEVVQDHINLMIDFYKSDKKSIDYCKKHLSFYSKSCVIDQPGEFRQKISAASSIEDIKSLLDIFKNTFSHAKQTYKAGND